MASADRLHSLVLAVATSVATLVVSPVARAAETQPDSVVSLPLGVDGDMPKSVSTELDRRLAEALGATTGTDVASSGCPGGAALRRVAADARYVACGSLTVDHADTRVSLSLVDASTGETIASEARACELCGAGEVGETVDDLGRMLRRRMIAHAAAPDAPPPPRPVDMPTRSTTKPTRSLVVGGVVTTVLGAAGLAAGIALAVRDEAPIRSRCSGSNVDAEGHCRYRYDTLAGGIGLGVTAAVALAGGLAMLGVARTRTHAPKIALRPSRGGLSIAF